MNNLPSANQFVDQGNQSYFAKDYSTAIAFFQTALSINPHQVVATTNLATCYLALGENALALKFARRAVRLAPDFPDALRNLGFLYQKTNNYHKSLSVFEKALKINPKDQDALKGKIIAFQELNIGGPKLQKTLQQILKLKIQDPDLLYNLGNLAARQNLMREAARLYEQNLKQNPNHLPTYISLTLIYTHLRQNKQKIWAHKKIIEIDTSNIWKVWSLNQLALAYLQNFQYSKVIDCLKKCLELDPNFSKTYNNLYLTYRQMCDWNNSDKISKNHEFLEIEDPFINLLRSEDPAENQKKAVTAVREITNQLPILPLHLGKPKKKIRLGYLSSDLRHHPIGMMVAPLFGLHNRQYFEVYVYSSGINDQSYYRKKPEKEADKFFDVSLLKPVELAQKINQDEIDILIDLTGFTLGNKLETCSYHPAHIQISYLGFPGTSGADFMDYLIADKVIIPPSGKKFYTEKVVYLPNCYQINDKDRPISKAKYTKKNLKLPENAVIYTSFNQSFKFDPETFTIWLNILKAVPNSVLWLLKQGNRLTKNLQNFAQKNGVEPNRIIFAPYLPNQEHLARLQLADIALDTKNYGGHTSTTDCIYASVPVITTIGKHFASRVSASILNHYGLPELITNSTIEYQDMAIELGNNPQKLLKLKNKIKKLKPNNPLFDTQKFVQDLEKIYLNLWQDYLTNYDL